MMKRLSIIVASFLLLSSTSVFAEGLSFGILANNRVVGTHVGLLTSSPYGALEVAGSLIYNKDRYTIGSGLVSVQSDNLSPGLRYGLGFKYVNGTMKSKDKNHRGDLSAVGFNLGGAYELPATINPFSIPIEVTLNGTLAPKSITFDETNGYMDFTAGLRFYMLENAYLALTHSYIEAEFDTGSTWTRYVNETALGVVLTF
ncbi:hypothetical protein DSLASN_48400 [Desulfoluna limicola]|uniref:Outer membrane protein beta-barrel domain-containing protein n=1 Tax=Desulfoluna limicola TaxID=2810562 RepID=A0ABM7PPV7_9BACT|nr:hypothetical protein [Desulfoluna limicola]BCS99208.1 hypothetical protein DSLASN_48400 [Desulfoluna limicola]